MITNWEMRVICNGYEDRIAFLQAVCRIAATRLKDGGTFPINGETWQLLDFAAGNSATPSTGSKERK